MSEPRLPREAESQVVEIDVCRLILGLTVLSTAATLLGMGLIAVKSRTRLRRQQELLQGLERLLQMIKQLRTETPTSPGTGTEGDQ